MAGNTQLDLSNLVGCQFNFAEIAAVFMQIQTALNGTVCSVTGNIVDNTDPQNPIVNETLTDLDLVGTDLIYDAEDGQQTIDLTPAVQGAETLTFITYDAITNSLIDNNESGVPNTIVLNSCTHVNNADGTYTLTNELGVATVIDVCDALQFCEINDLGNVNAAPTDGQVLTFDLANNEWIAADASTDFNSLTDGDFNKVAASDCLPVIYDHASGDFVESPTNTPCADFTGTPAVPFTLTCAAILALGCYTGGVGINVAADGTISSTVAGNTSEYTNTLPAGNRIVTLNSGAGGALDVDVFESIITANYTAATNTLVITNEAGTNLTFALANTTHVNNADGTYTLTNELGTATVIDVCDALQFCEINDLGNVNATPTDGQVLTFDLANNEWIARTITAGGGGDTSDYTNGQAGNTIATLNSGAAGAVDFNVNETITTNVIVDCVHTDTREGGATTTYKTLPVTIDAQNAPITGIYGTAVGGGCPTRIAGTCGEQAVFGDDGELKLVQLVSETQGGGFAFDTSIQMSQAVPGGIPGYTSDSSIINYSLATGNPFAPPFEPTAEGLSCYKWIADVKILFIWNASPATAIPPPTQSSSAARYIVSFGGGNTIGFNNRLDSVRPRFDTLNHSEFIHGEWTFDNINQGGANILSVTGFIGKSSGGDAVMDAVENFAWGMTAQVTFRLVRV